MSIAVTCAACSSSFNVKDEYAGKRAKCPKCGERITVPSPFHGGDTVRMPPPAAKRSPALDADDDRPVRRRRRDEDEDDTPPRKKGNALVIILAIVGGLVVVCGGGSAAVYLFVIKPAADLVSVPSVLQVRPETLSQVRGGMNLAQVERILGRGTSATPAEISAVAGGLPNPTDVEERWTAKLDAGHVYSWVDGTDVILVAFSGDPNTGGIVVGIAANVNETASEPNKLPGAKDRLSGPRP